MIAARAPELHRWGLEVLERGRRPGSLYAAEEYVVESGQVKSARASSAIVIGSRIPKVECRSSTTKEKYALLDEGKRAGHSLQAGCFAFQAGERRPDRMFAGRACLPTNRRFQKVSEGWPGRDGDGLSIRLTLYGCDRSPGPTSTARSAIRRVDSHARRLKVLYDGFDLCSPNTSVSMEINGRRPVIWRCSSTRRSTRGREIGPRDNRDRPKTELGRSGMGIATCGGPYRPTS